MSTDNPTPPAPTPVPPAIDTRTAWQKYGPWVRMILVALAPIVSAFAVQQGCPKTVVQEVERQVLVPIQGPEGDGGYTPTTGWVRDDDEIANNLDGAKTLHFDATPAGMAVMGDDDVFLWRNVRKALKLTDRQYPNVNQQSVGCCVGCGWKHCSDVVQASAIAQGAAFDLRLVSVEAIYAGSRVDVGKGRLSGDGSNGSWAMKYVRDVNGIAPMQKYQSADLSTFSPARARAWGRSGVPADVKAAGKDHAVKGCALVKSWADVKKAVQQGYPVAVCSDQGFTMTRDATGRCRPQGVWPHCMAIIGVRSSPEGAFILNSWGDQAHTGPVWPADAPPAGFWADSKVIDSMVRQGDSFALADVQGFPARKLNWEVRLDAAPRFNAACPCLRQPFVQVRRGEHSLAY